jgi:hypothetical protein
MTPAEDILQVDVFLKQINLSLAKQCQMPIHRLSRTIWQGSRGMVSRIENHPRSPRNQARFEQIMLTVKIRSTR